MKKILLLTIIILLFPCLCFAKAKKNPLKWINGTWTFEGTAIIGCDSIGNSLTRTLKLKTIGTMTARGGRIKVEDQSNGIIWKSTLTCETKLGPCSFEAVAENQSIPGSQIEIGNLVKDPSIYAEHVCLNMTRDPNFPECSGYYFYQGSMTKD